MPAIPPPSVVRDPVTGDVTITLSRPEVDALYHRAETESPFGGSDDWDYNDAYQDGFADGLDAVFYPKGR